MVVEPSLERWYLVIGDHHPSVRSLACSVRKLPTSPVVKNRALGQGGSVFRVGTSIVFWGVQSFYIT